MQDEFQVWGTFTNVHIAKRSSLNYKMENLKHRGEGSLG